MLIESLVGDAASHLWANWDDVLFGATIWGIVAHVVNTFPTPKNVYGQWLLGSIQFAVGQRKLGQNTTQGNSTVPLMIPGPAPKDIKGTGDGGMIVPVQMEKDVTSAEVITPKPKDT